MPCNCGRKRAVEPTPLLVQAPAEWGPTLWLYLHALAERLGSSGSALVDAVQAAYFHHLLQNLPRILPCPDCQAHATQYLSDYPLPPEGSGVVALNAVPQLPGGIVYYQCIQNGFVSNIGLQIEVRKQTAPTSLL